jgi:hypothetical protein
VHCTYNSWSSIILHVKEFYLVDINLQNLHTIMWFQSWYKIECMWAYRYV